jgi:AAA domain-containing protein
MTVIHTESPRADGTAWSAALNELDDLVRALAHANPDHLDVLYVAAKTMAPHVREGWIQRRDVVDRFQNAAEAYGYLAIHGPDVVQATLAAGLKNAVSLDAACRRDDEKLHEQQQAHTGRATSKANGANAKTSGACLQGERHLISRRASEITPRDIDFLWNGRLARGKHTCVAGEPGAGKSQLSIAIIAAITTGGEWPCGEGRAPRENVIILNAEDDVDDTIVPRLAAAGADPYRVHIVNAVTTKDGKGQTIFNLQADLDLLEKKIDEIGDVALVNIDPVSSYMGKTDSHKNSEVRGVLEPISEMAARKRTAILSVTHFSKSNSGTAPKALHRFVGSIAFVGAPRAAFAVIEDRDNKDRMLFLHAKNNMAKPPQGLAFRLEQRLVDGLTRPVSCVAWENQPVAMTANEALRSADKHEPTAKEDAMEFLRIMLANGPVKVMDIEKEARSAGLLRDDQLISQSKPFRAARKALGIAPFQPKGQRARGLALGSAGGSDALRVSDALRKDRASDGGQGI